MKRTTEQRLARLEKLLAYTARLDLVEKSKMSRKEINAMWRKSKELFLARPRISENERTFFLNSGVLFEIIGIPQSPA